MFGSQMLEVAVGLSLLYFLLALICSAVTEAIAGFTRLRARTLERAIAGLIDDPRTLAAVWQHPAIADLSPLGGKPAYIPAGNFAQAVLDSLAVARAAPAELAEALNTLPEGRFKRAMRTLLDRATTEASDLRSGLERWFDDAMERLSGSYKRLAQGMVIAVAVAVTLLFNVDTLAVADGLWRSDDLRAAVVAQAQKSVTGTIPAADLHTQTQTLAALHLPIGWGRDTTGGAASDLRWLMRLGGWLLSTLALSLGAPFWFDLLGRLVNLRLTGRRIDSQASTPVPDAAARGAGADSAATPASAPPPLVSPVQPSS